MGKIGVYKYGTEELLGIFLSIAKDNGWVMVYYADEDGHIKSTSRENILVKEIPDFGPC